MTLKDALKSLKEGKKIDLKDFDLDLYFERKEEHDKLVKEAKKKKKNIRKYLEENMKDFQDYGKAIKNYNYAIQRLEELAGIAEFKQSIIDENKDAFKRYIVMAYYQVLTPVKNRTTGEVEFKFVTRYKGHPGSYPLTFPGGFVDRPQDQWHLELIEEAKQFIDSHPLKLNQEEFHIVKKDVKVEDKENEVRWRLTVDLRKN